MLNAAHDRPRRSRAATFGLLVVAVSVLLILAVLTSVSLGAVHLPIERVARIAAHHIFGVGPVTWTPVDDQIVWTFRAPRALLAALVGAALAVSGAVLQAVARNALADPYVFGISGGASVAAVASLTLGGAVTGGLPLPFAAFTGAALTTLAVYALAQSGGRVTPLRLVLSGVAAGYVLSAVTSFLVLRAAGPDNPLGSVLTWLAGSFGGAQWSYLGVPSVALLLATGWLLARARAMNALLNGEEGAISLGVNVQRFRLELFLLTALLVGVSVAVSGAIGFVGLMIPHVARLLTGSDHRRVLPLCALLGAAFLVTCDVLGRVVIAPTELPVGIVTAVFGGPFFVWLLRRNRRETL
ncbi:FecCD family ABC transporter permease [Deinococcus marmoris]|nr:iron ABC transporter permease [Deinococcus marmoris]